MESLCLKNKTKNGCLIKIVKYLKVCLMKMTQGPSGENAIITWMQMFTLCEEVRTVQKWEGHCRDSTVPRCNRSNPKKQDFIMDIDLENFF